MSTFLALPNINAEKSPTDGDIKKKVKEEKFNDFAMTAAAHMLSHSIKYCDVINYHVVSIDDEKVTNDLY